MNSQSANASNTTDTSDTRGTGPIDDHEARDRLWELIKDIRFAMFTAQHAHGRDGEEIDGSIDGRSRGQSGGHLHSRPMTTQNKGVDRDNSLWFFMSLSSQPATDIATNPEVNISYADVGADSYVSVSGRAAVVDDLDKKQQLWSKMAEAWFPGGFADPDLALVQVRISHAASWDVKESKLVQLFKMAQATFTGKPPTGMGEHAEIRMG